MSNDPELSSYIFIAKTNEAYRLKILSELICNTIKTSFFTISNEGISMSMFDQFKRILLVFNLNSENFQKFIFTLSEPIHISLTSSHLHKMLKSIKKKDVVEFFIKQGEINQLYIKTTPKENNRRTISNISVQMAQNINVTEPVNYDTSIIIQSSDFNKMTKDISLLGSSNINIKYNKGLLSFSADADGVMKREVTFGEYNLDRHIYESSFLSERFDKISKISSLNDMLHIYTSSPNLPIKLKTNIGNLGVLKVYVKSNEIINQEDNM